ncbi:MAG: 3-phosphoshikimate 1-carboxyvinyltransferase [Bacteroidota bacterium]
MNRVRVSHPDSLLHGTIRLPGSKSISNRALILRQVSNTPIELHHLSTADDTVLMQQALQQHGGTIHLKNAGTCMRFLTAYFAATENASVNLLCDERMEQRPIGELVDALLQLGADIQYLNKEGFPPLHISGKKLKGGTIQISASASSQYVSALMMIAPLCEEGLTIQLTGTITSLPYIEMTARMMAEMGWHVNKIRNSKLEIRKKSQFSNPKSQISNLFIEPDWSAASYWYEMAALSKECNILLEGLRLDSLQGDAVIAEHMKLFGVLTIQEENGIRLRKESREEVRNSKLEIRNNPQFPNLKPEISILNSQFLNLNSSPDLAPTIAVTAAALNIPLTLTGLQNLVIKESNRLEALRAELTKLGFDITITDSELEVVKSQWSAVRSPLLKSEIPNKSEITNPKSQILTYGDHRMALAFAPLALVCESITIEQPEVVEKSYPHFWEDLQWVGFRL